MSPASAWQMEGAVILSSGCALQAHAGCVIYHQSLYYMYGENKAGRTYQPKNPGG